MIDMDKVPGELKKLERMLILRTIICEVDMNYLDKADLENILYAADELKVGLKPVDLDDIYNSEYDRIKEIYCDWKNDIVERYEKMRNIFMELYMIGEDL